MFRKNRDRLLAADVATLFFNEVPAEARALDLVSDEHFTVDGTLLEAWASLKSSGRSAMRVHRHRTIPRYRGHVLTENRNGLAVDVAVLQATGTAERDAALAMAEDSRGNRRTR